MLTADAEGFVRTANPAAFRLFGEPLLAQPLGKLFREAPAPGIREHVGRGGFPARVTYLCERSQAILIIRDLTESRRHQQEVARATEQERRRIGQDLHDDLGQQLTGLAYVASMLALRVEGEAWPLARRVVEVAQQALAHSRSLARGLVVMHLSAEGPTFLGDILSRAGPLPARQPHDGEPLEKGLIYVPEPDRHMLVVDNTVRLANAPRENRCRPAIDPLFRSAAVYGRNRTVGVVLSGLLDDGAQGLQAVRRCGGTAIVQSPADALHGDMPQNALDAGEIHYTLPVAEMGELLAQLVEQPNEALPPPIPEDILLETRLVEKSFRVPGHERDVQLAHELGTLAPVVCPECGGPLWQVEGQQRFRCHLGHAYGIHSLLSAQDRSIESAVWAGLRSLEERIKMLESLARRENEKRRYAVASVYEQRMAESRQHAQALRALLLSL